MMFRTTRCSRTWTWPQVGFGLSRQPRREREARVAEVLELVGLPDRAGAWPHELSGGQQQRVALARALAPSPSLLLLDEPFSNLDIDTREHLAAELRVILRRTGTTALLVTHDQAEAFAMADAIGVMDQGRILQWADAATLYAHPRDAFVAGFIGRGCVLPAAALGLEGGGQVLLRPDRLLPDPAGAIQAEVVAVSFRGPVRWPCCGSRRAGGRGRPAGGFEVMRRARCSACGWPTTGWCGFPRPERARA